LFARPLRGIATTSPLEGPNFSGMAEWGALKHSWDVVGFQGNSLLEKFLEHCPKRNIPPVTIPLGCAWTARQSDIGRPLGGASGIRHLAVLLFFSCRFALVLHAMIHKVLFRRFLLGFYALAFSGLLFGLTRYSYRAKELLVCWLIFCSFFAVLALALFAAVLAAFAGQYFLKLLSVAKLVIPELVAAFVAAPQRPAAVPPILAAVTLNFPVDFCVPVVALDSSSSYPPIDSMPLSEKPYSEMDVQNCTDSVLYTS
jgi:hypothetical protein